MSLLVRNNNGGVHVANCALAGKSAVPWEWAEGPAHGCVSINYKTGEELRTIVESGLYLVDLKTTTGVFQEAHFQVAGYAGAAVECGHPVVDHSAILRVTKDGRYEFVESVATYEDFLAVKQAFDASRRIEKVPRGVKAAQEKQAGLVNVPARAPWFPAPGAMA